jgi:hypothetical protein
LVLFFLVLLFSARTAWGQEPSEPASTPLSLSETPWPLPWTQNWEAFDQLWSDLKAELKASETDSKKLLQQLSDLRTETQELQSSYQGLTQSYRSSEADRMAERETAEKALQDAYRRLEVAKYIIVALSATTAVFGGMAAILGLMMAR